MSETNRSPLILVADDDNEFRTELVPTRLEMELGAETILAENVLEACMAVAEHGGPEGSLDLVILDMHMPLHRDEARVDDDGGIRFLRSFGFLGCPVVVFTAYPSYQNCVLAAQAGAAAYLPKATHDSYHGPEGGIDQLVAVCKQLLEAPISKGTQVPPNADWLNENRDWLGHTFGDQWVAFVDKVKGHAAGLAGEDRGDVLVMSASTCFLPPDPLASC
jgi:CheY-like chemotaxis protein